MHLPSIRGLSLGAILLSTISPCLATGPEPEKPWIGFGGSALNNRWASTNKIINSSTVAPPSALQVTCKIPFAGGMSITPTVISNIAYFPAWNGSLVALDYTTCKIKWQINVTALIDAFAPSTPIQAALVNPVSRTTPQVDIANKILYFASFRHCIVFAADLNTGQILAQKQISSHPLSQITSSPSLHLPTNTLYLGVASSEESIVNYDPNYGSNSSSPALTFIGLAVAIRYSIPLKRFTILWTVKTLPETPNSESGGGRWSGAAIWGSNPSLDVRRNQVYFGTGNLYSVPDYFLPCTADPPPPTGCSLPARVWQNSVLAIDMTNGNVHWVRRLGPIDSWTVACTVPPINPDLCVGTPGPDADFGMAPVYVPRSQQPSPLSPGPSSSNSPNEVIAPRPDPNSPPPKRAEDILIIGQKSGDIHAIYPSTGLVKWSTKAGPSFPGGGILWGISVDDSGRVYFNEANSGAGSWKPGPPPPPGIPDTRPTVTSGAHSAVDLFTGEILWQTAAKEGCMASSPPTTVGDLVIMGRQDYRTVKENGERELKGAVVFLRKDNGEVVRDFDVGLYHLASVAVQGRYVLFGTGHHGQLDGDFWVLKV